MTTRVLGSLGMSVVAPAGGPVQRFHAVDELDVRGHVLPARLHILFPEVPGGHGPLEAFSDACCRFVGVTHEKDVVLDRGKVSKRKKKPSKKFREQFGHTPLSIEEEIPWKCQRLVIGAGTGQLPVMKEVKAEAKRRRVKLIILPTAEAIEELKKIPADTNAILHLTC